MKTRRLADLSAADPIRTRVAVIGSGHAGTEVATTLVARGHQVMVLESGVETFDADRQALGDAVFSGRRHRVYTEGAAFHGYLDDEYRGFSRVRQLGGTSVVWTGKWRMFEPRDFEPRTWIPGSGWPISFADVAPYYDAVMRDHAIALAPETFDPRLRASIDAFAASGFRTVPFFSAPSAYRSPDRLAAHACERLSVVTDATAIRIDLADGGDRVAGVVCRSLGGEERRIEADHVVLAMGGFETPRLLLASNSQHAAGVGNGGDLVGRFYQDHLKNASGRLEPGPLAIRHAHAFQRHPRPRVSLSLGLPDAEQARLAVLEASLFFKPRYLSRLAALKRTVLAGRPARDEIGPLAGYGVKFAVEQSIDRESRVRLASERDAMGVPRLDIDWRHTDLDAHSFNASLAALTALAAQTGLGRLSFAPDALDAATDSAHHIGTTRMGASARTGVVDPNCTVFGIPNLHIAGSAVFATGAAYSPTMTIIALARRLGDRIDGLLAETANVRTTAPSVGS